MLRRRTCRGVTALADWVGCVDDSYVVLTSVDRDDLPDGGAGHFAMTVEVGTPSPGTRPHRSRVASHPSSFVVRRSAPPRARFPRSDVGVIRRTAAEGIASERDERLLASRGDDASRRRCRRG